MKMPEKFEELASYNKRISEGVMHIESYRRRMEELQKEFNEWINERN